MPRRAEASAFTAERARSAHNGANGAAVRATCNERGDGGGKLPRPGRLLATSLRAEGGLGWPKPGQARRGPPPNEPTNVRRPHPSPIHRLDDGRHAPSTIQRQRLPLWTVRSKDQPPTAQRNHQKTYRTTFQAAVMPTPVTSTTPEPSSALQACPAAHEGRWLWATLRHSLLALPCTPTWPF